MGLMIFIQSDATQQPTVSGHVRLSGGLPVVGAQVMLFDLADLRRGVVTHATTDEAGQFALPLAALGRLALPQGFALGTNYPNPFNPATIIPYELAATSPVKLEVFNTLGQRIATLVDGNQEAGSYQAQWDGTDAAGQAAAAGLYFYRLTVDGVPQTGRMVLVDGQAGVPMSGAGVEGLSAEFLNEAYGTYGLVVSGPGMVAYVDAEFGVEAGMGPVDIAVKARRDASLVEASPSEILGDVDNSGQVDIADGLLVAAYSVNAATALPNNGDIGRGDVNGDNQTDITDAWLLATYKGDLAALGLVGRGKAVSTSQSRSYTNDLNSTDRIAGFDTHGVPAPMISTVAGRTGLDPNGDGWHNSGVVFNTAEAIFPITAGLKVSFDFYMNTNTNPWHEIGLQMLTTDYQPDVHPDWEDNPQDRGPRGNHYYLIWMYAQPTTNRLGIGGRRISDGGVDSEAIEYDQDGWNRMQIEILSARQIKIHLNGSYLATVEQGEAQSGYGKDGYLHIFGRSDSEPVIVDNIEMRVDSASPGTAGKIYWAGDLEPRGKIYRANFDGTNVEDLVTSQLSHPCDIALDVAGGKMYWTDMASWNEGGPRGAIRRANLDGSNVQDLVTSGLGYPCGLALDVAGGKMYWTDMDTDKIRRANLDGSNVQDLVTSGLRDADGIALDVASGKMYWIDRGRKKIQRANLDGSNVQDLVTSGFEYPVSIALDAVGRKMYWTESGTSGSSKIRRANLDGSNVQDLVTFGWQGLGGIALDVAGGKMYWGNEANQDVAGIVRQANLDGSNVQNVVLRSVISSSRVSSPRSIALQISGQTPPPPDDPGQPDLVVSAAWVDDNNPSVDDAIRVDVTVLNQGNATASSSRLRYYWSNDDTYSSDDTYIDYDGVRSLDPGETDDEYENIPVLPTPGTYYLIACADAEYAVSESNESNNCKAVRVISESSSVDLEAGSGSVSNSRPSPGETITVSVPVTNVGSARSSQRGMIFLVSTNDRDANDASDDFVEPIETIDVPRLNPGATTTISKTFSAPSSSGTYYYIACVGTHSEESNNDNDCSDGSKAVEVIVGDSSQPDLVVENVRVDDPTPFAGDTIRMDVTVRNQGNATAPASVLKYYWSANDTYSSDDTYIDDDRVPSLNANATADEYDSFLAVLGTYYLIACADAEYAVSESNESNNCAAVRVVVSAIDDGDDLSTATPISSNSTTSGQITAGDKDYFRVIVSGSGTLTAHTTGSMDTFGRLENSSGVLTSNDDGGPDSNFRLSQSVSSGTYYIRVTGFSNSTTGDYTLHVSFVGESSSVDLEVGSGSVSNSRPSPGETITVSVPVTNVGNARSSQRGMIFLVSTNDRDANDASDDFVEPIETIDVPRLNPGATTTISKTFSAPSSSGDVLLHRLRRRSQRGDQ